MQVQYLPCWPGAGKGHLPIEDDMPGFNRAVPDREVEGAKLAA